MHNYYNLRSPQLTPFTNKHGGCMRAFFSDISDSISVNDSSFYMRKVVAQKKICNTKNLVRFPHLQKAKHAVRNLIHLRNGLRVIQNLRKRQSKLRGTVILKHFVKTPLHENREIPSSGNGLQRVIFLMFSCH